MKWIVIPTHAADPLTVIGVGNRDVRSTELIAYELGQRWSPTDAISTDLNLFYNRYDRFIDGVATIDLAAGQVVTTATSVGDGHSYGGEASIVWRASDSWRWIGAYSYLRMKLNGISNSLFAEGRDPRNQASLRASWNVTRSIDADLFGRYTDGLRSYSLPGRCDLDARLGWRATSDIAMDIVGRNLFAPRHREFGVDQFTPTLVNPVPRSVFFRVALQF